MHQLAPVSTWGLQFVTAPIPRERDRGDVFFITASAPNTGVEITITTAGGVSRTSTENLASAGRFPALEKYESMGTSTCLNLEKGFCTQMFFLVVLVSNSKN